MAGPNFPITSYPNGFSSTVTVLGQPVLSLQSNNTWWVDSVNGNNGWKGTFQHPFASLARATAFMQGGDTIMVAANHTETLSDATSMVFSIAGVRVIGMGVGTSRPVITFDTTTAATVNVTAAGVSFTNIRFQAGIAAIVSCFTLTTATGFTLEACSFSKTSTFTFLVIVTTSTTSNQADGMQIIGCDWRDTATTVGPFVSLLGTNDNVKFHGNTLNLGVQNDVTAGVKAAAGKICTNLFAYSNRIRKLDTSNTAGILFGTDGSTSTGILHDNIWVGLVSGTPLWSPASSGIGYGVNYATGVADKSGGIFPAADS